MAQEINEDEDGEDGVPIRQSIIVGEGAESFDLRRSRYYVKGNWCGVSVMQLSTEPGFVVHTSESPVRVDISFSMRLKLDMHVEEILVEYDQEIVLRSPLVMGDAVCNRNDRLEVNFSITHEQITVFK